MNVAVSSNAHISVIRSSPKIKVFFLFLFFTLNDQVITSYMTCYESRGPAVNQAFNQVSKDWFS